LLAHLDFGFERVPVAQAALADLAIADGVDIVLTAVVLDLARVGLLDGLLATGRRVRRGAGRRGVRRRSWSLRWRGC